MNRYLALGGGALALLVVCVLVYFFANPQAELGRKTYQVGVLSGLNLFAGTEDGFKAKLTELGYVEGENITYDIERTNFDPTSERETLQRFVSEGVDLIFVFPTEVSLAAKEITAGTQIPVVFAHAVAEEIGLVESVRAPGGNLTGVRFPGKEIAVQRLEILHQVAPKAKNIFIPYQDGYPIVPHELEALRPRAKALGLTLIEAPFESAAALKAYLAVSKNAEAIDAVLIIPEPLTVTPEGFAPLRALVDSHGVVIGGAVSPATGDYSVFGTLPDNESVGVQAATIANKIFKGVAPGVIPLVTPDILLTIDLKAALRAQVEIPEELLARATSIIR